jgi:cytochrome b pre-mRNA-processing protein 3
MLQSTAVVAAKDAMLGFLFRGLTAEPARGAALFAALVAEARRPSWYREGEVPDTLDGRFAVLATITAIALARLERESNAGNRSSVALTERFIEVMESEHRELGLGDPTLGRTVRKLVGMLARRTELWRSADQAEWTNATRESLYKDAIAADALEHSAAALRDFSIRLDATPLAELEQGVIA